MWAYHIETAKDQRQREKSFKETERGKGGGSMHYVQRDKDKNFNSWVMRNHASKMMSQPP